MKQGICIMINDEYIIRYLSPFGAGVSYFEIKVDKNSEELWQVGKFVQFQIENNRAVIIPSLQDKMEKFFSKFNPFDSPHAGISKMGTGPGKQKIKEDIISPQSIPDPKEYYGQLFNTKEKGWVVRYDYSQYKFKGTHINTALLPVIPNQAKNLTEEDEGKKVFFVKEEYYLAPEEDTNNSKGEFINAARLTSNVKDFNKEINLFHPETSSHEVFAIKDSTAFIGYKLPNGDFHFECVPFTEKPSPNVQVYVEEQIQLHNIEEHQTTWMESVCQYWYNQGKLNNEKKS